MKRLQFIKTLLGGLVAAPVALAALAKAEPAPVSPPITTAALVDGLRRAGPSASLCSDSLLKITDLLCEGPICGPSRECAMTPLRS